MCVELDQDDVMRATGRLDRHQSLDAEKTPLRASYSSVNGAEYIGKTDDAATGELPAERLKAHEPPFNCSAIDYFGPMIVTQPVSRRRPPYSHSVASWRDGHADRDVLRHATNFTGQQGIKGSSIGSGKVCSGKTNSMEIHFHPARHMGGAWERMIRTIKAPCMPVQEGASQERRCLLLEVEHIVNAAVDTS
ncbi:hypothetical protein EVAR_30889_1 [Eumeta japonica]|uniref:Uncharacterized protein n=1 Tax=Eumeta variegata TaxID=151549 RepID=A0A4C1V3E3_EUMVA|nr:hypothetical protein EVAR_30889_1 [Eumeta japonica]